MKPPHIPRCARLRFRIGNPSNGAEGEPYHHAAPDQVGENVPESAVERQQRHAEHRRKPCLRQWKLRSFVPVSVACKMRRKITLATQPNSDT